MDIMDASRMLYGLYLSAQGAQNQTLRLQTIANNVANANTTAFKRDLAVFQDHLPFDLEHGHLTHPPGDLNQSTGGTTIAFTQTDFTEGPLINTRSDFDVAITGPGFLQVKHGKETFLTRNGQLTQNDLGEIVTQDHGWPVLNTEGESIAVPLGASQITITADGTVFAGNELGDSSRSAKSTLCNRNALKVSKNWATACTVRRDRLGRPHPRCKSGKATWKPPGSTRLRKPCK